MKRSVKKTMMLPHSQGYKQHTNLVRKYNKTSDSSEKRTPEENFNYSRIKE